MKRFEAIAIIRERDRVHDAMQRGMTGRRDLRGKPLDLIRVFHVTHIHRLSRQLTFQCFATRIRSDAVDHCRALLFECLRNKPGDALSIRYAEYEKGFSAELEKV